MMWKVQFMFIVIVQLAYSLTAGIALSCERSSGFVVCNDPSGGVSIVYPSGKKAHLKLKMNRMYSINPGAFRNLANLTKLEIGPEQFECSTPSVIDITPETFQGLSSVGTITLRCVELRSASSPFKDLDSLKRLKFIRNQFVEFPQELCANILGLKEIVVEKQHIRSISPASFSTITEELKILALISSELEFIEPQSFKRFRHLRVLDLAGNNLATIGSHMFDGLHRLVTLDLSGNCLREISSGAFSGLHRLRNMNLERSLTEEIQIEPNTFHGLNLMEFRLSADELNGLEAEAFSGVATKDLVLSRTDTIDFQRNLFGGLTVEQVYIFEEKTSEIDLKSWGLGEEVVILSARRGQRTHRNRNESFVMTVPYEYGIFENL